MTARTQGMPKATEIKYSGELAKVILRDNIRPDSENGICIFDEYTVDTRKREGLEKSVNEEREKWLTFAKEKEKDRLAAEIRWERNKLLEESDWTLASDSPLNEEEREKWREYRQALRDMPEAEGFPYALRFPERPR